MADGNIGKKPGEWVLQLPNIKRMLASPPVIRKLTTTMEIEHILYYLEQLPAQLTGVIDTQRAYFAMMTVTSWQNRIAHCQHFLPTPGKAQSSNRYESIAELVSSIRQELMAYTSTALTTPEQDERIRKWRNLAVIRAMTVMVKHIVSSQSETLSLDPVLPKLIAEYGLLLVPFLHDHDYLDFLKENDPETVQVLLSNPLIQKELAAFTVEGNDTHCKRIIARTRLLLTELCLDCRMLMTDIVEFESLKTL